MIHLSDLIKRHPGKTPAELFDIACAMEKVELTWAGATWQAACNWLDCFAQPYAIYPQVH